MSAISRNALILSVFISSCLYMYNKGHDDGYFNGVADAFFKKTTVEKECLKRKKCTKHITKKHLSF